MQKQLFYLESEEKSDIETGDGAKDTSLVCQEALLVKKRSQSETFYVNNKSLII